jgi:alanine-alpha-ketoisovalerate/valine-pyruvate aminotransferase
LKATVTQAAKDRTVTGTVTAAQTTRTNLLAKTEREDLLCKSFDLTVGTTSLLAAVAGQYHKVYGWDYESDTDGANEFSATISGVACKFARRVTKGVHAMTLVHPIICDVNSALSFISAGNTKLSLRYKTEA